MCIRDRCWVCLAVHVRATANRTFLYTYTSGADSALTIDNISVRKVLTAFDERGAELVTNGTFDSDASGWTKGWDAFGDELSHDASGKAKITLTSNSTGAYPRYVQAISGLTVGAVYQVSWEADNSGGSTTALVWTSVSNGTGGQTSYAQGTYYYTAVSYTHLTLPTILLV